jgi:hypothetical protein
LSRTKRAAEAKKPVEASEPARPAEAPDNYLSTAYHEIETEEGVMRVEGGMVVVTSEGDDVSVLTAEDAAERFPGVSVEDLPQWPPVAAPDAEG